MRVVVGISDMKVSNDSEAVLVTYSLGSCIGVAIYDAAAKVGGLLHYLLPESKLAPEKAQKNPYMFADTGIPALFKAVYKLGAKKQRMKIIVVGGSQIMDQAGFFNIGKRNDIAVRKMFHKNNVIIDYRDVGGIVNRTIKLEVKSGDTWIKVSGQGVKKI